MIVDASVVVAGIGVRQMRAAGARRVLLRGDLAAPHLLHAEVTHSLRRRVRHGSLTAGQATAAMIDLLKLPIELHPFEPFADRIWELRETVTAYDAWYIALAEASGMPLATLDTRLAGASGPRCAFVVPDVGGSL